MYQCHFYDGQLTCGLVGVCAVHAALLGTLAYISLRLQWHLVHKRLRFYRYHLEIRACGCTA